ncbi:unnamed protein product, partial [Coccothraustes coccothraustes]
PSAPPAARGERAHAPPPPRVVPAQCPRSRARVARSPRSPAHTRASPPLLLPPPPPPPPSPPPPRATHARSPGRRRRQRDRARFVRTPHRGRLRSGRQGPAEGARGGRGVRRRRRRRRKRRRGAAASRGGGRGGAAG